MADITGRTENVIDFAKNVTAFVENVTVFADNVTVFTENVATTTGDGRLTLSQVMATIQVKMAWDVAEYLPRVALALGVPGNILAFVVILRMRPFTTSSFMFCGAAVSDLLYLGASAFDREPDKTVDHERIACYVGTYLVFTFHYASLVFSLGLATERALAVWMPLKVGSIVTMTRCKVVMSALLVSSALINAHYLYTYQYIYRESAKRELCGTRLSMMEFTVEIWMKINLFLTSLGPGILFLVCNVIIITGLKKSKQLQRQMTSDDIQLKEKAKQSLQVTLMLMAMLTLFVVTCFPLGLLMFSVKTGPDEWGTPIHLWMIFFSTLFTNLRDFNHALNCYCYFLTARRFRAGVLDLLTCGGRVKVKDAGKSFTKSGMTSGSVTQFTTVSHGRV
ncbi:hypothetical protein ACOMHN_049891 [Nucella lapillus]